MTPAPKIATVPMGREYAGWPAARSRGSGAAQPLVASERRKNWRLAGRSAMRRTR